MRCKVGDLALVVKALKCPEHIGKVVSVVARAPDLWASPHWIAEPQLMACYGASIAWEDTDLLPLPDSDPPTVEKSEEAITA